MIQRIQTLYLFLSAVSMVIGIFFPLISIQEDFLFTEINPLGIISPDGERSFTGPYGIPLVIPFSIAALLLLFQLMQYKSRVRQLSVGRLNILLLMAIIAFNFFATSDILPPAVSFQWGQAAYFPVISLLLLILANRAIKKDEDLVKSVDRLR